MNCFLRNSLSTWIKAKLKTLRTKLMATSLIWVSATLQKCQSRSWWVCVCPQFVHFIVIRSVFYFYFAYICLKRVSSFLYKTRLAVITIMLQLTDYIRNCKKKKNYKFYNMLYSNMWTFDKLFTYYFVVHIGVWFLQRGLWENVCRSVTSVNNQKSAFFRH